MRTLSGLFLAPARQSYQEFGIKIMQPRQSAIESDCHSNWLVREEMAVLCFANNCAPTAPPPPLECQETWQRRFHNKVWSLKVYAPVLCSFMLLRIKLNDYTRRRLADSGIRRISAERKEIWRIFVEKWNSRIFSRHNDEPSSSSWWRGLWIH